MAIVLSGTTGIDAGSLPVSNCGNTEVEGNLNLSGVGTRITGDFSNTTASNRVMFQSNVTNGNTGVYAIPNTVSGAAAFKVTNSNDLVNTNSLEIAASQSATSIISNSLGTASPVPLTFVVSGGERMRIDSSGNVGIGTIPSADYKLYTTPNYTGSASIGTVVIGASGANYGSIGYNFRTTGTSNNYLYNASNSASMIRFESGGFNFLTAPTGTAGNTIPFNNAMTLDTSGNLLLTSGTGGLGYGTGSGGTVTQLTSKSTSVTLNKPTGTIMTNGSAVAAGATVDFSFFNSVYTNSYDIINLQLLNTVNANNYNIWATNNGPGFAFKIFIKNISASSLSDVLTINFSLTKGAIS